MLTGNPPRSQLKAGVAGYKIPSVLIDIVPNASLDAKEFIAAALTWLVWLIAELNKWLLANECM